MEYICNICGEKFTIDENKYKTPEAARQTLSKIVKKHIKNVHNLSIEDYCVNTYYNGVKPTCACGCGTPLEFNEKNCLFSERHGFNKYCHCSHVAKMPEFAAKCAKNVYKSKYNDLIWLKKHYDELYGWDVINNALQDFLHNDDFSKNDICAKYNVDCRTLKKIWLKFNLITEEEFTNRTKYNKYKLAAKHRRMIFKNADDICEKLFIILKQNPLKYTTNSLVKYFNETNLIQIEQDIHVVHTALLDRYGEEIYEYLLFGSHSREEIEYIKILKYFFGKRNVVIGKKLKHGETNRDVYIYDCCINDKLLIEYDGSGFWHQNKIKDINKENFAIEHGYKIMRISDVAAKDINTLTQIKKTLGND